MAMDEEVEPFRDPSDNSFNFDRTDSYAYSYMGNRPSTPELAQQEAELKALQLGSSQEQLPEILRGLSAEAIQAAQNELLDAAINEEPIENEELTAEAKVVLLRPPTENGQLWAIGGEGRFITLDTVQKRMLGLDLESRRSITVSRQQVHDETVDWKRDGTVTSREGAELKTGQLTDWTYVIHPQTGQKMSPGFEGIEAIGNEGMVGNNASYDGSGGKYFLVTAEDQAEAIKRYGEIPETDKELLAYPFFLHASNLVITRFDPKEARKNGWKTLLQLQGKDPFGLEAEEDAPQEEIGQKTFNQMMQIIHGHETRRDIPIQYIFEKGATHLYFPSIATGITGKQSIRQMVVSRYDDETIVVALQKRAVGSAAPQSGFFIVKNPDGDVILTDLDYRQRTNSESPDQAEKFGSALDSLVRYNDKLLEIICNKPVVVPDVNQHKRWFKR